MDKVVCIKCNWKGYRKNGLLKPCPKCKGIVVWWQKVKEYEKGFWISQKELQKKNYSGKKCLVRDPNVSDINYIRKKSGGQATDTFSKT